MRVASRLNFRFPKVVRVDFGLLDLGNLLAKQVAAMPNYIKQIFEGDSWLDLSALDNIGEDSGLI